MGCGGSGLVLLDHAGWDAAAIDDGNAVFFGPDPDGAAALPAGDQADGARPGPAGAFVKGASCRAIPTGGGTRDRVRSPAATRI